MLKLCWTSNYFSLAHVKIDFAKTLGRKTVKRWMKYMMENTIATKIRPRFLKTFGFAFVVLFFIQPLVSHSRTLGLGVYSGLADDLFIARLWIDSQRENPIEEVTRWHVQKKLEFKFLGDQFTFRRFTSLVMQNAAINADPQLLQDNSVEIEQLVSILRLKGKIVRGDHVVFHSMKDGVSVRLNGISLGFVKDPDIFVLILNAWVGEIPPSRSLKAGLLGEQPNPFIAQVFDNLQYSSERRDYLISFLTQPTPLESSDPSNSSNAVAIHADVMVSGDTPEGGATVGQTKLEDANAEVETAEAHLTNITKVESVAESPVNPSLVDEQPAVEKLSSDLAAGQNNDGPDDGKELESKPMDSGEGNFAGRNLAGNKTLESKLTPKAVIAKISAEPDAKAFAVPSNSAQKNVRPRADQLLSPEQLDEQKRDYARALMRHAQKNIVYPRRYQKMGIGGSLLAVVTIARDGAIIGFQFAEKTEYDLLNQQVENALKSSQPFPGLPEVIEGESFTFSLPISFVARS